MGGSHGGFLTGNLVGQYPSAFKCGVLRNPVMDLGLMIHVSDIPDWTYVEAFGCKVSPSTMLGCWHRLPVMHNNRLLSATLVTAR